MSANLTCYNPDGTEASNNPCGIPNLSTCCGDGWDCLSNGLCRQHGTTAYSQSTCTNPSYQNCLSFCNQSQFDGFTEVSRCEPNGNSWCCAGSAGQGLGGPKCCDTGSTTPLEPYPFSAAGQSPISRSSISSSLLLTTVTPMGTTSTSVPSPSFSIGSSLRSTSQISIITATQTVATPSQISSDLPSPHTKDQAQGSRLGLEVGIPVAVVVVLLLVFALFILQNRRFQQRFIQLRDQMGADFLGHGHGHARPNMQQSEGDPVGELDITHYELNHRRAPKHELYGNEIHEINNNSIPEHELVGDAPR